MRAPHPMLDYLGLSQDDQAVVALLRRFLITRQPSVERDAFDDEDAGGEIVRPQDWVSNLSRGVEFGFEDEASFNGEPPDVWGLGPMLLTQIYLYARHAEAAPYEGNFPFDIAPGDDRAVLRAKLDPLARERRSRRLDTWAFDGFMVTAGYLDDEVLSYLVLLCQPPAGEVGPADACPPAREFAALVGKPADDRHMRDALRPLGYPGRLQWIDKSSSDMDLREDFGAYLEFSREEERLVLAEVLLLGDRRYGSAIWPGELPGGLRFGAGWSEVLACAGCPPSSESEYDFTLLADWVNGRVVTRIEYSTMTNQVLAVSIYPKAD